MRRIGHIALGAIALASVAAFERTAYAEYAACAKPPTKGEIDAAHGAYIAGRHSFDEGDYNTAITYFTDAYRRDCTKHELLPIIARAYELNQNRAEALVALETFLKRVPANDPGVEPVRKRIANLRAQTEAKPAAPAASSGPPPTATPTTTTTAPAAAAPHAEAASGASTVPAELEAPSGRKPSVVPWVVAGLGVVVTGIGVFTVLGGVDKQNKAHSECPTGSCEVVDATEVQRRYDDGTSQVVVGGIVIGAGVLVIGGSIIWGVLDRQAAAASRSTASWLAPAVSPSFTGVVHGGTF